MDLKVLKERKTSIFSTKVYVGHLVSEKRRDDFKSDEDFQAYLEQEKPKEYIIMRESSNEETKRMGEPAVDEKILERLPAEKQIEYQEKRVKKNIESSDAVVKIAKDCVIGSSFTIDGKEAPVAEVVDILFSSSSAVNYIIEQWMKGSVVFPKKSDEKSKDSAE